MDRGEELADAHWKYLEGVYEIRGASDTLIREIEFHYISAFIHGYKHGKEDKEDDPET